MVEVLDSPFPRLLWVAQRKRNVFIVREGAGSNCANTRHNSTYILLFLCLVELHDLAVVVAHSLSVSDWLASCLGLNSVSQIGGHFDISSVKLGLGGIVD